MVLQKTLLITTVSFNSFYNSVHILNETDVDKKYARLKLINLFTIILKEVFSLLAIDMPEKM
jgi:arginyl-tRNA synthetase